MLSLQMVQPETDLLLYTTVRGEAWGWYSCMHLEPKPIYRFSNGRLPTITIINCGLQQPADDNPLALATSPFFPFVGKTTYRSPVMKSNTNYLPCSSWHPNLHYTRIPCGRGSVQMHWQQGCASVCHNLCHWCTASRSSDQRNHMAWVSYLLFYS